MNHCVVMGRLGVQWTTYGTGQIMCCRGPPQAIWQSPSSCGVPHLPKFYIIFVGGGEANLKIRWHPLGSMGEILLCLSPQHPSTTNPII